ncbi:hypothetical protein [Demequina muriae]|uniref:Uncharacterized protein n=1 Tax=Demequina muriae TaxID=3051664 RepID=A0ABT8GJQ3_9MICO|nr:hypothetical protein [Demequina sp. EGI L300058]MDN4481657.1 hypothetical protein [Demequina sp. EGI L300058]
MWIVRRTDIGRLAYGRLVRDRVITPLLPGVALPLDIPDTPAIRRRVLADAVPTGCQATGAAALWAHGVGARPAVIDIRCPVGRHVRSWSAPLPVAFHGVGITAPHSPVADVATATADARRWAPATGASEAVSTGGAWRR